MLYRRHKTGQTGDRDEKTLPEAGFTTKIRSGKER